jgi:hypothetical protein
MKMAALAFFVRTWELPQDVQNGKGNTAMSKQQQALFPAGFLLGFYPEDGGDMFFRNVI